MHTSDTALGKNTSLVRLYGLELEVERRGRGQPLLVLYGEEALELDAPVLVELAKKYELIIPSPPGFGASERPDWIESPDDIAYIYLDLAQSLGLHAVPTIGFSFGGWLALEMATKDASFCAKLARFEATNSLPGAAGTCATYSLPRSASSGASTSVYQPPGPGQTSTTVISGLMPKNSSVSRG